MSNFGNCIEWVLRLEDRRLSGRVVNLRDGAGLTRYGITQASGLASPDFFTCSAMDALEQAKDIYHAKFWVPLGLGSLQSDELAATILSFAVNDGIHGALKVVQAALGLPQDGVMGPQTLGVLTAHDNSLTASLIRDSQLEFYKRLEEEKPADLKFADGWDRRARAVYPDLPA